MRTRRRRSPGTSSPSRRRGPPPGHAGVVDALPHGVERGVERREPAGAGGDRRRSHDDDAGPEPQHPVQLRADRGGVAERDVGSAEYAVLAVVAPVVVQPPVEAPHHGDCRVDVVAEELLVEHAERREQPDRMQALGVHHLETGLRVHVVVGQRLAVAQHLGGVPALGVPLEVVAQRSGLGDGVPGRIGHRPGQPAPDEVVLAAAHVHPLHHPGLHRGVDVAGERVVGLVVVVVGVEGPVAEIVRGERGATAHGRRTGRRGPRGHATVWTDAPQDVHHGPAAVPHPQAGREGAARVGAARGAAGRRGQGGDGQRLHLEPLLGEAGRRPGGGPHRSRGPGPHQGLRPVPGPPATGRRRRPSWPRCGQPRPRLPGRRTDPPTKRTRTAAGRERRSSTAWPSRPTCCSARRTPGPDSAPDSFFPTFSMNRRPDVLQ